MNFSPKTSRRGLIGGAIGLAGAATLSACSDRAPRSNPSDTSTAYKAGSAQLKVQLGEEITGINYPEPWDAPKFRKLNKFADGSKTFKVVVTSYPGQDYKTNAFSKWLEETTGVKVEYIVVPAGEEGKPKINTMMTSNQLPDAFMRGYFTRSEIALYGQQGLFLPTGKLIDEYCPEHLDFFKMRPDLRPWMTAPDGNIYGFGWSSECYHCYSASVRMWINGPWLEKLGLQAPKTTEELRTVLTAFRDKAPAGAASIPMSDVRFEDGGGGLVQYLLSSFTYSPDSTIEVAGDKLVYSPTQDGYRDGLAFIAGLYKDKLIDPNLFTQTRDQLKRRMMAAGGPQVGISYAYSQGDLVEIDPGNPASAYNALEPLGPVTGPDGKATVPWLWSAFNNFGLVLTRDCQDPAIMAQWADAQFSQLSSLSEWQGPQGGKKSFEWAKEGEKGIDGRQAVWSPSGDAKAENIIWWNSGPVQNTVDFRNGQKATTDNNSEAELLAAGKLFEPHAVAKERYFDAPVFTSDQATQISELDAALRGFQRQSIAEFVTGRKDITADAEWDAYKKRLDALGVGKYLEINQTAWEATK